MVTASPLSLDTSNDPDVFPLDDLSALPPDARAAIEAAEAELLSGRARLVPHAQIQRALEEGH